MEMGGLNVSHYFFGENGWKWVELEDSSEVPFPPFGPGPRPRESGRLFANVLHGIFSSSCASGRTLRK